MLYTMTTREAFRPGGAAFNIATAEAGGKTYEAKSRNGATMRLARQMVQDGLPDGAWQVVNEQGRVRYSGGSLYRLAKLTVHETDREGPRFGKYQEFKRTAAMTEKATENARA